MKSFAKIFMIGLKHIKKWVIDEDHITTAFGVLPMCLLLINHLIQCNDLENNKGYTVGVISKIYQSNSKRNLYEFYVNGEKYSGSQGRGFSKIAVGDSAIIKYDRTNPKNNELVGYFEYALDRSKLPDTVFCRRQIDSMRRPLE